MNELISGDDHFSELMKNGRLSIMNESFEEELMQKVEAESSVIKSISRNRKISLVFFSLGVLLGLVINFSLPTLGKSFFGNINTEEFSIYFQVGFVVFILFYLEKLFQSGVLNFKRRGYKHS